MMFYALKMLIGDRVKYIGIVLGLCFASFIIIQQSAILVGIVNRTTGLITDTSQPNIWVMDPTVQYIDDIKPMKDTQVFRVRSVEGVAWAVPFFKGTIQARLTNGTFQTCVILGIDDATLIGGPPTMIEGRMQDLRMPDAIFVNQVGASTKLASKVDGQLIPMQIGTTMELNDHRAYVAGISSGSRTFQSQPVLYTTYGRATTFIPSQRKQLSFVIARAIEGVSPEVVAKRIKSQTGLSAYTTAQFKWLTLQYYIKNTGIFVNFGVAIALGFIIGMAIAGQTLYTFTVDHLPHFAVFKAMGADNKMLIKIVLLQAAFVSIIGWGIGVGAASLFGYLTSGTELSFSMPLWLYFLSFFAILFISLFSSLISMRRIIKLDPAIVFKG